MVVPVVQNGHPALRQIAREVTAREIATPAIQTVIKNMAGTLRKTLNGVAIAAPQIAQSLRMFLVLERVWNPKCLDETAGEKRRGRKRKEFVAAFVNPVITKRGGPLSVLEEGCLSVEGVYGKTRRYANVTVKAYNASGKTFTRAATGLFAQVIQHEVDHLDGKLFIDHAIELYKPGAKE